MSVALICRLHFIMDTKLSNLSELTNILNVKSSLHSNLLTLFNRFGLGCILSRMSLEKSQGISAVQLILFLCLFVLEVRVSISYYVSNRVETNSDLLIISDAYKYKIERGEVMDETDCMKLVNQSFKCNLIDNNCNVVGMEYEIIWRCLHK